MPRIDTKKSADQIALQFKDSWDGSSASILRGLLSIYGRVRIYIIRNARIQIVGKYHSCIDSNYGAYANTYPTYQITAPNMNSNSGSLTWMSRAQIVLAKPLVCLAMCTAKPIPNIPTTPPHVRIADCGGISLRRPPRRGVVAVL